MSVSSWGVNVHRSGRMPSSGLDFLPLPFFIRYPSQDWGS